MVQMEGGLEVGRDTLGPGVQYLTDVRSDGSRVHPFPLGRVPFQDGRDRVPGRCGSPSSPPNPTFFTDVLVGVRSDKRYRKIRIH